MKPRDFIEAWKPMNSQQLARLVNRSKGVVDHWLVDPDRESYKEPPKEVKDFLSTVHILWTMRKLMDRHLAKRVMLIYDEVMDEREEE
jgi:hypothetical protein